MNEKSNTYRTLKAEYVISSPDLKHCPPPTLPEIAIVGRSNVGKSSLINLICQRRSLAKTSSTPGKTRMINFFLLVMDPGPVKIHLVDLPGYGYSKVDKGTQEHWGHALQELLEHRAFSGLIHLIDARHKPTKLDLQMREWIVYKEIPCMTVLTKSDKISKQKSLKAKNDIEEILELRDNEPCILSSATKKMGVNEILESLCAFALPSQE